MEFSHGWSLDANGLDRVRVLVGKELGVEGVEQLAANAASRAVVQLAGVGQEVEVGQKGLGTASDLGVGAIESLLDAGTFELDGSDAFAEFLGAEFVVRGKVKEALFAVVELLELLGEVGADLNVCFLAVFEHGENLGTDSVDEVLGQFEGSEPPSDRGLDLSEWQ